MTALLALLRQAAPSMNGATLKATGLIATVKLCLSAPVDDVRAAGKLLVTAWKTARSTDTDTWKS